MSAMVQAFQAARTKAGVACPYCGNSAQLVDGTAIYPHRPDLHAQKFWQCAPCDAYVGCHRPNRRMGYDGTQPLGRLANAELRAAKNRAHAAFDPIWRDGEMGRKEAYAWLADQLKIAVEDCHIGEFDLLLCKRTVEICTARRRERSPRVRL